MVFRLTFSPLFRLELQLLRQSVVQLFSEGQHNDHDSVSGKSPGVAANVLQIDM